MNLLDKTTAVAGEVKRQTGINVRSSAEETLFEWVESIFSFHISFSLDGDFKRATSEEKKLFYIYYSVAVVVDVGVSRFWLNLIVLPPDQWHRKCSSVHARARRLSRGF